MSLPASQLTAGVKILNGYPVDYRYLNPETDQPYNSVSSANSLISSGVRYVGLTINIHNTEYWYKDGIDDIDLIPKELGSSGGGTHSGDTSIISYPDIVSMTSSQTDLPLQTDKHIIHVLDASGDDNINFETSETRRQALYRLKNNTLSGSIDDYYLLSAPYKVDVFKSNITVAIDDANKSVGKYTSGQEIPCEGMTFEQFARDISIENLPPTASINFSPAKLEYNTTDISNSVNLSNVIRNAGASVDSFGLRYRKGPTASFTEVTQNLPANGNGTWTFDTNSDPFDSRSYEFEYNVVDTAGGTVSETAYLEFKDYLTPTATLTVRDSANTVKPLRETGDIHSKITVVSSNRSPLVGLIEHDIRYRKDGGAWTSFDTVTHANASSINDTIDHDDSDLDDAKKLQYQFIVRDELSGPTSIARTSNEIEIKFQNYIFFGRIDVLFPSDDGSTYSVSDGSSIRSFAFNEIKGISNGSTKIFTGEVSVEDTSSFTFNVEIGYHNFAVMMPAEYIITDVYDDDYNAQATEAYVLDTDEISGATVSYIYNDAGGVPKNYNMYRLELGTPYTGSNPKHIITFKRVS